jgi:YidC/Oxa1 family membrane protein insertase
MQHKNKTQSSIHCLLYTMSFSARLISRQVIASSIYRASISRSTKKFGSLNASLLHNGAVFVIQHRNLSTAPTDPAESQSAVESASSLSAELQTNIADHVETIAAAANPENVNFVIRNVMLMVDSIHNFVGIPYWEAIALTTIGLRFFLIPVVIKTAQGTARLANVRPVIQKITDTMNADLNASDNNVKLRYQKEMQAAFIKHKVNPIHVMMWPFAQLPIFISFFMALREMGNFYPGYATGGIAWFQDLAAADPYYVLPLLNSITFLAMVEIGSLDGAKMQQQASFKAIMRGLAVAMVPLTASMPSVCIAVEFSLFFLIISTSVIIGIVCLLGYK